jgi:hypothetical protein
MGVTHILITLQEPKGAFLLEWVLRTFATHLALIDLSCYRVSKTDGLGFPKAALLLAIAAMSGLVLVNGLSSDVLAGAAHLHPDIDED